jgi:hypothetical protein
MDELEILKRDWKKKGDSFNQVSEKEIYGMLHKRSSSVVKWILIISILEIIFWVVLSFIFNDEEYNKTLKIYHLENILPILTYVNYVIIAYFIYLFYKNFKTIHTTQTVKNLMQSILKTRKTVKHYVWYNLAMTFFSFMLVFIFQIKYDPNVDRVYEKAIESIGPNLFYILLIVIYIVISLVIVAIFWLFYRLIYGILLRRLHKNYKELEKIDF